MERAVTAINPATGQTFLSPYRYFPVLVSLEPEELEEYIAKTQRLVGRLQGGSPENTRDPLVELLLFERANIVKNACGKYRQLERILDQLGADLQWTIVYCSPQQLDEVVGMLSRRHLRTHRFTMEEGTSPRPEYMGQSERQYLLDQFRQGEYQVLVAMRCLDEGVDVPAARTAVLLCSSGNPREYVQRLGRVLRRCEGKQVAGVYDIVAAPAANQLPDNLRKAERAIFRKELERCREIAKIAENGADAVAILNRAMDASF